MSIEQALESITKMELMCHYCRLIVSKHDLSDKYDKLVEQSNLDRERAKSQIEHLQFIINSIYNRTLELNEKNAKWNNHQSATYRRNNLVNQSHLLHVQIQ